MDSIPEIDFELPDLPAYCAGDTMLVIATGALEYTWSSSDVIVGDLHSHCVPIVPQTNVSLGLSANSANGCTNTATIDIEIAPLPEVAIAVPTPPVRARPSRSRRPHPVDRAAMRLCSGQGRQVPKQANQYEWTAPPTAGSASM